MATVNPKGLDYFLASVVHLRECFNESEDKDVEKCVLGQLKHKCGKMCAWPTEPCPNQTSAAGAAANYSQDGPYLNSTSDQIANYVC